MAEPFFRMLEIIVPPMVAANGTTITYHGSENLPAAARDRWRNRAAHR